MDVDVHHIVPWREVGEHNYEDLIALCPNCHRRADRGEIDRKSLYAYKELLRDAMDRFSKLEVDFLFTNARVQRCDFYPYYMKIFFERLLDAGYVKMTEGNSCAVASVKNGIFTTPIQLHVTEAGRAYVESIETQE